MRNLVGIFAVVGVLTAFTLVTLWAADWIDQHEGGWYE